MTADKTIDGNDFQQPNCVDHTKSKSERSRKRGAPFGNRNGFRHGVFAIGRLPPEYGWVTREVRKQRRKLEVEIIQAQGTITAWQQAALQSCCRHEARCLLLNHWLGEGDKPLELRMKILADISSATARKDAALALLRERQTKVTTNTTNILIARESIEALPPDELNLIAAARAALRRVERGETTPDDNLIVSAAQLMLSGTPMPSE